MIIFATALIVFLIGFAVFSKKKHINPYIAIHKNKWQNERDYEEYIKWLDKKGGDLPLKEVKMNDDLEVLKQVSKNINS